MQKSSPKKGDFLNTKIIPFLKNYGILILFFFLAWPYLYKYIKKGINTVKEADLIADKTANTNQNATGNPSLIAEKVKTVKKKYPNLSDSKIQEINASALKIATAFGTNIEVNYPLFGFEFFKIEAAFEDEKKALIYLKQHTGTFPVLEDFYYTTATRSRNLKADLIKYLSKSQLTELSTHYKKAGYSWL